MKIYFFDGNDRYEITEIEYSDYNGRDTYVKFCKVNSEEECQEKCFYGWLSIDTIIRELEDYVNE